MPQTDVPTVVIVEDDVPLAERIAISPAPPSATALGWDEPSSTLAAPVATVFHTITPLDDGDFLWVGGFELEARTGAAGRDAPAATRRCVTSSTTSRPASRT